MLKWIISLILFVPASHASENCSPLLNHTVPTLVSHTPVNLCQAYQGKVLLIVNTASKCGYTYQYDGLEKLYRRYQKQGLVVLGFPSNDFGGQEPGSEKEVANFCRLTYNVDFPMFAKSSVKEGSASPLYRTLAEQAGHYPRWNFHKYLIDRSGKLVGSFPSPIKPLSSELVTEIEAALKP